MHSTSRNSLGAITASRSSIQHSYCTHSCGLVAKRFQSSICTSQASASGLPTGLTSYLLVSLDWTLASNILWVTDLFCCWQEVEVVRSATSMLIGRRTDTQTAKAAKALKTASGADDVQDLQLTINTTRRRARVLYLPAYIVDYTCAPPLNASTSCGCKQSSLLAHCLHAHLRCHAAANWQ